MSLLGEGNIGFKSNYVRPALPDGVIRWRMEIKDVMDDLKKCVSTLGNDQLIQRAVTIFTGIVNKATIQGNIDREIAESISLQVADDETEVMGLKYEEYGLEKENRDLYIDMIGVFVRMGLSRAQDDWERKHSVDQGQERVNTHQGIQAFMPMMPGGMPPQKPMML